MQSRIIAEQSKPVEREHHLDQHRAGKEHADEGGGEAGDHQQHRIAKHMVIENTALRHPFGARSHHIELADLIQKRVFRQHGQRGEAADHCRQHRQGDMPEVVQHFAIPGQCVVLRRGKAAQRKPVQIATTGKQHD